MDPTKAWINMWPTSTLACLIIYTTLRNTFYAKDLFSPLFNCDEVNINLYVRIKETRRLRDKGSVAKR